MIQPAASLRGDAESLARHLPALLARAERLAAGVIMGEHGRRKPGAGDSFWQYRPARAGDAAGRIDWRRSARSDQQFVQEKEWQAAQAVSFWVDASSAMRFASRSELATKHDRAALLALSGALLLERGGERVGLVGRAMPPMRGGRQIERVAAALAGQEDAAEYGAPDLGEVPATSRAVLVSDFLGDMSAFEAALYRAADRGISGVLLQVLDPAEEDFPYQGRTLFESPGGGLRHETRKARDLRERYLARLATRKAALQELGHATGWQVTCHHTGEPAQGALLWLYQMLEARR